MSDPSPATLLRTPRTSEAGSAYLVAILALVVLTIAGLSLALITQTEMQIGANEKSIERAFYAADTGISLAIARTLREHRPAWTEIYEIPDPEGYGLQLEHEVEVSPFFPIADSPCNLCDVTKSQQYGQIKYRRATHLVASYSIRRVPGTEVPLAEKAIAAMVELQPWDLPLESYLPIEDQAQLAKLEGAL